MTLEKRTQIITPETSNPLALATLLSSHAARVASYIVAALYSELYMSIAQRIGRDDRRYSRSAFLLDDGLDLSVRQEFT